MWQYLGTILVVTMSIALGCLVVVEYNTPEWDVYRIGLGICSGILLAVGIWLVWFV